MLPPNFDKRSKRGFAMPFGPWLRGQLWEVLHDCLSARSLQRRGWFEVETVRGVLERFEAGQESWPRPWLLMMAELWARAVLDQAAPRVQRQSLVDTSGHLLTAAP